MYSIRLVSQIQQECTSNISSVYGVDDWCVKAFGQNRYQGNNGSNYVLNCCDSFIIEFAFDVDNDDIYADNPVYAAVAGLYLDLNDPDLIFENCQVVYNAYYDRDEVVVDMTFPPTNQSEKFFEYARVIDPSPSSFVPGSGNKYPTYYKDDNGERHLLGNLTIGTPTEPRTCLKTSYVSDLTPDVFLSSTQANVGIDDYETLIVDQDLQLADPSYSLPTTIVVGSGSQIIVKSGFKLEVLNRDFRNCTGKMWKGIYVEEGAELIMKDSEIPYAEHAITFEKGAKLTLENNEFIDNYVHMKALSVRIVEDTGPDTEIYSFKNNVFKGTGSLVSKYEGQTTNPQDYPYAGILIGDGSAGWRTCGTLRFTTDNASDMNTFSFLANGILNQRDGGDLVLKGSTFNNINSTSGIGYSTFGFGIKQDPLLRSCIINGFDNWPLNYSFKDVDIALRSNLANIVKFDKQVVENCVRGVYSTKSISSSYINNNTFSTSWNAIEIANSNIRTDFEIIDNTIDLDLSTSIVKEKGGIILSNVNCQGNKYDKTSLIKGNSINTMYAQTGIGLFDVENLAIKENAIDLPPDITDIFGIDVMGGQGLSVTCNAITGHYGEAGVNDKSTGINIFSVSSASEFTCNDLEKTDVGIYVSHMNAVTDLKGNEFTNHSKGIEYDTSAATGPQKYHGNIWSTWYDKSQNHFGALHNNTDQDFVITSQFIVNDNQGSQYNTEDYPGYFVVDRDGPSNFMCSSLNNCEVPPGLYPYAWDKLDSAALTDTSSTLIYDDNVLRDLQWQVYRNMQNGIITYSSAYEIIAQNLGIDSAYLSAMELRDVLDLLSFSTFADSILNFVSVDTLSNEQHDLMFEDLTQGYDTMKIELQSYISSEGWLTGTEDNYLGYHSLALEKEAELWNTDTGYINSFQIPMCSFEGGEAWSKLNALQPSDSIQFLLDVNCASATPRESHPSPKSMTKDFNLTVSPNPAQYEIFVKNIDRLPEERRNYSIFDLNGRIAQQGVVNKQGIVDLNAEIQSGLYILSMDQQSVKFIVIR